MDEHKGFLLDLEAGYFRNQGVDVMAFDDIYPEGHQSGVSVIMHGHRVATNGDVRFEQTPGQFQPTPKQVGRTLDPETNTITASLRFPDEAGNLKMDPGVSNPMIYPDGVFAYTVSVRGQGGSVLVTVDLAQPVLEYFLGGGSSNYMFLVLAAQKLLRG